MDAATPPFAILKDADPRAAYRATLLQALDERGRKLVALDEEYRRETLQVQNDILVLRKQYNTMAPISLLPPELMSLVFQAFVADYWSGEYGNPWSDKHEWTRYRGSMCGWIVILQICHHWRNIALGSPQLWTRIELGCDPFVELALARSGSLPLHVFAGRHSTSDEGSYSDASIRSLFPAFQRLRSAQIRISLDVESQFELAEDSGLKLTAPNLETLSLNIDTGASRIPLLSALDLPRLASLTIKKGSFTLLQAFIRPTLTGLRVSFSPSCRSSQLITILDNLPLLQDLKLSGIEEDDLVLHGERIPRWCRTVHLPRLKCLSLTGRLHSLNIVHLLRCLEFPANTEITFCPATEHTDLETEHYEEILPHVLSKALVSIVPPRAKKTQMAIPRVIEVQSAAGPCSSLDVTLWSTLRPRDSRRFDDTMRSSVPRLSLTIGTRSSDAIVRFFDLVDLSEVVILDFEDYDTFAEGWLRAFRNRSLPKLQELILQHDSSVVEVLEAMSIPLPAVQASSAPSRGREGSENARRYLFPTLKRLTLIGCLYRGRAGKVLCTDVFHNILKTLRVRAKHGYKLQKLVICSPGNLKRQADRDALADPRIADVVEIGSGWEEDWTSDSDEIEESEIDSDDDVAATGG